MLKIARHACSGSATRVERSLALWMLGVSTLSVLASTHRVHAQQAATAAEALFRAGRVASRRGDAKTACDRYRESYRIEPAYGTLFNIASCEITLGELGNAWRDLQEVVHALPESDPRVAIAQGELAKLDQRLSRLTITRASQAPAELEVRLGEIELGSGSFDVALPVEPGGQIVETRAEGHEPRRYVIELHEGEQRTLEVDAGAALPTPSTDLQAAPAAETPAAPARASPPPRAAAAHRYSTDDEQRHDHGHLVAWTLVGTGAIGLAAAAVCGGFALDRLSTVHSECDATKHCSPAGLSAGRSGQTFFVAGLVSFGIALVSSGLGTYLLLTTPPNEPAGMPRRPPTAASKLRILPDGLAISFD